MAMLDRLIQLFQKWGHLDREYRRDVLSLFDANPEARLLDIGCDDGEFTLKVAEKIGTRHVFGIDVVRESVERAKARGIDCYEADLDEARFPFEDESFDAVCANQIIEHLSKTDGFIREIRRVLKVGGYAVISTPNVAAWHCIAFLLIGWQPYQADVSDELFWAGRLHSKREESMGTAMRHHRRLFTLRALTQLVEYHGCTVCGSTGSGFPPFPARVAKLASSIDKRHAFMITVKVRKNHPERAAGT
jgi:methionine biosynthesis protein MetW